MYRDGRRRDPQCRPSASDLSDADMADLSAFYAAQAPRRRPAVIDAARAAAGRPLAEAQKCTSCHGPELMGQQAVPRLAGQDFDYLLRRLSGYKAKTTSDLDGMMTMVAQPLTDADIENLTLRERGTGALSGGARGAPAAARTIWSSARVANAS
jgi:cytochrome c553